MKLRGMIATIVLVGLAAAGCGVKQEEYQTAIDNLSKREQELKDAKARVDELTLEATGLRQEMLGQAKKVDELTLEATGLRRRIEELEKADNIVFAKIPLLEESGDVVGAKRAYEAFIASYPSSSLIDHAHNGLRRTSEAVAALEERERAQRERDARKRQEEQERQRVTAPKSLLDWSGQFRAIKRTEVLNLLGKPDQVWSTENSSWTYSGMPLKFKIEEFTYSNKVVNSTTGDYEDLEVHINTTLDLVVGVRSKRSNEKIEFKLQEREAVNKFIQQALKE